MFNLLPVDNLMRMSAMMDMMRRACSPAAFGMEKQG